MGLRCFRIREVGEAWELVGVVAEAWVEAWGGVWVEDPGMEEEAEKAVAEEGA